MKKNYTFPEIQSSAALTITAQRFGTTSLLAIFLLMALGISAQNLGFEATPITSPPNNWTAVSGTWTVNTNATYVRTGTQSMTITDPATSGSTIGTTNPFVTTAGAGNYLISIGWGKSNVANNALFYLGYRSGTTNTINPASTSTGQPANLNDVTWSRISSASAVTVAAGSYGTSLRAFRSATTTGTVVYIDDIITYASTSNIPDLSDPDDVSGLSKVGNVLSWTNGADNGAPASGIGGVVIIRADGANLPRPVLNDQAMFTVGASGASGTGSFIADGNTWTVVANITDAVTTSFDDVSAGAGPYSYVVYMRDNAFNYSNGAVSYACAAPPTGGSATASASVVCATAMVNLNVTGNSFGIGQTYVWQRSFSFGGPYTDITSSSSSSGTSITPTTTAYYRVAITCTGMTTPSDPVLVTVNPALPGGNYTINSAAATGGSNFQSFTDAVAALNCGIAGPVVFNVDAASGPYTEQVTIPALLGSSSTNTVTFNGNGRILRFTPVTGARHVLQLNGADYVTINNLNIVGLDATFGWGVHLTNKADNNTISNCTIDVSAVTSTTTSNSAGITASGSSTSPIATGDNASFTTITGNTIIGGGYGVAMVGVGFAKALSNNISNNTIKDFYSYGISMDYQNGTTVANNDINRQTRVAVGSFYGIDMGIGNESVLVNANRIHDTHTGATTQTGLAYGIQLVSCDATAGAENRFTNNLIYNFNSGSGTQYGIYNSGSDYALYYHNTILLDGGTSTAGITRGFYQITTATGIEFKNNIVKISRAGTGIKYLLYFGATTTASDIASDYNDLLMTSPAGTNYTGYLAVPSPATSYTTLADWQGGSGVDANSVSIEPNFINPTIGNLKPFAATLDNLGTPIPSVTTDFLGLARDPGTPDIGAYEFDVSGCTAPPTPGTTTSDAAGTLCPGSLVNFGLTGNSIGTGQTYELQSSSTMGGTYTTISGAPQASPAFTQNPTVSTYYRTAVTCSGATEFSTPVFVSIAVPLPAGAYTINSAAATGGSNFQTFADAVAAINCGIAGAVTFNVDAASGPYNEQVTIPVITGASAVNTVTFNGNGRTLQFTPVSANRHIIKLDGADYVTINNLNIVGLDATYGWGVHLINGADNNTISNCTINLDAVTSTSSSNSVGIVATNSSTSASSGGNNANNNIFSGNTISGAYESIRLYGGSATVLSGNNISNNTLQDFYIYGVYLYYTDGSNVNSNNIMRPNRATITTFNGVYLSTGNTNTTINANRIHDTNPAAASQTAAAYGVYISGSDATTGQENKVTNNLIYNFNSGSGAQYGLYNSGSDYALYHHNTVVLDEASSTAGTTYGFYQITAATGIELINNIIKINRAGTGFKYALYFSSNTTTYTSNYNDLLMVSSGGTNATGYFSPTAYTTLGDWQTGSGQDGNSVAIEPNFSSPGTGNYKPLAAALNNLGTASFVTNDIVGDPRDPSTPDMGAYEFDVAACVAPPTAGTTTSDAVGIICPGTLVNINLSGNSIGTGQTYQLESSANVGGPFSPIGVSQAGSGFTDNPTATIYYRVAVTCSGNTTFSTPVMVTVAQLYPGGNYTINSAVATGGGNFQTFADAMSAINCGIAGPVVFDVDPASGPYTEQVTIGSVFNTNATNTITINGNGRTLQFAPVTGARHILKLDGTDYTTINNLRIVGTDATYGYGIVLTNQANNNSITNSTIDLTAVTSTTSTNSAGITATNSGTSPVSVGNNANTTNITGNTITGGYYGIAIVGASATKSMNNNILNNTLDILSTGISLDYNNGTLVNGNDISRKTRVTVGTTFYGLDMGAGSQAVTLNANRIHDTHTAATTQTGAAYGIYFSGTDAPAGFENKVTNNLVYNFNSASGTQYGIYNSSSDSVWYYHNTVVLDNASSTAGITRTFYQITLAQGLQIKNNLFKISRGGTGVKQLLYFATSTTTFESNNNDLYITSTGGTTNNTAYLSGATPTDYPTLTDWKTTGNDANSVALEPFFENEATGVYKPQETLLDNLGAPVGVANDIVSVVRSVSTPDIGAYEFTGTVTVPVKLVSIFATRLKTDVVLNWVVASETNSNYYLVERSANGSHFTEAGSIGARNNPQGGAYNFTDLMGVTFANGPALFYRIKIVDKDGRYEYSPIVIVKLDKELVTAVDAYPNPFRNQATLRINVTVAQDAAIMVAGLDGKTIQQQKLKLQPGTNLVSLDKTSQLAHGIYVATVIIDGRQYRVKLVKE